MMQGLNYQNVIFFDLETTGLEKDRHQIAQIAAYDTLSEDTFEIKMFFNLKAAEPKALEVIHFDKAVWKREAVRQEEGLVRFTEFVRDSAWLEKVSKKGKPYTVAVLAGYRIDRFDVPFLMHHLESRDIWAPFELRVYDVFQLALWLCPGLTDYTLGGVCKYLGIKLTNAHDALADVIATREVAKALLREVWEEKDLPAWAKG